MKISDRGLELIRQWEGVESMVYLDSAGLPTIGCGHLLTKSEISSGKILIGTKLIAYHLGLSPEQITVLLKQDLSRVQRCINNHVTVELTQNQFDALCSFIFNVGVSAFRASTLRKMLNQGQYAAVPIQLRRWVWAAGKVEQGLVNRRENESKLFKGVL